MCIALQPWAIKCNEYTSRILVNDGDFLGKLLFPSSVATHFYRIYTRTYNIDPNLLFLVKKHYLRTVNHTYQFPFSFLFFIFVVSFCLFFIRAINFLFGSLRLIEEQNQRWNLFHEKTRGGIEIWKTRRNGLSFGVISLLWLWLLLALIERRGGKSFIVGEYFHIIKRINTG